MKKISIFIFSISLLLCFLPIKVFADSNTYIIGNDNCLFLYEDSSYNMNVRFSTDVRIVRIIDTNNMFVFVSEDNSFNYSTGYTGCPATNNSSSYTSSVFSNNHRYYWAQFTIYGSYSSINSSIPAFNIDSNIGNFIDNAIYYTYGAGSVDPVPEPIYGDLVDVGYNTKIAGSGDSAINNLDTITWNPEQDSNGNDISDMSVTIRAVPGKYSAQSSQSILEQLYSNFVLDTLHVSELDTVNASDGSFSVTWNDVVHEFDLLGIPGFWFATKDTVKDPEGGYIKRGWIYQIRLEGEDYTGDWQIVYTATSSGVQNDLNVVNSSTINQTLINSITEINNLNNTENNWYINNTTINMGEYSDPGSSGKPWWAYLLEAIVSLLNGVIDAIANLVGSIIDGLLGLFSFDSFSVPDFTTNKQTIKQNSGIFGESIDLLQGINSTLSNADGTSEPILYYPGLELMDEEFIPEITINLNTYVTDLGLTEWHNLAYVCTDAMIWISLIYTIYRKLIGVFKK